jgi:hypothetical protein
MSSMARLRFDVDAVIDANTPAIDAALQRYSGGSDQVAPSDDYEHWRNVIELRKSFKKVRDAILLLRDPADPERFKRLAAELAKVQAEAPAFVEYYRPKTRKEQLIIDVLLIWTSDGTRRLGTSRGGPACRFLCQLLPWRPEEKTAMGYIRDEKIRRQWKVTSGLLIDEAQITVVDKDGKIK